MHDLAISKYAARREKDLAFRAALARHRLTRRATLLRRAADTALRPQLQRLVLGRIRQDFPQ